MGESMSPETSSQASVETHRARLPVEREGGPTRRKRDLRSCRSFSSRAALLAVLLLFIVAVAGLLPAQALPVHAQWLQAAPATARAAVSVSADTLDDQVLAEVNRLRAEAGEPGVIWDPSLDQAASLHAQYLINNVSLWNGGGFSVHNESASLPGFTAVYAWERAMLAGFPHNNVGEVVITVFGGSAWEAERLVRAWLDAPLHRKAIMERSVSRAGFGYATNGSEHAYVLDFGRHERNVYHQPEIQVYPYDGQSDVPTEWDGIESPPPFPDLAGHYPSGYPVTAFAVYGLSNFVGASLTLHRTADGTPVPLTQGPTWNYAFAPLSPLQPGTTYTAILSYTMASDYDGSPTQGNLTWHFTTEGVPSSTTTTSPTSSSSTTTTSSPTTTTTTGPPPTVTTTTTTTAAPPTTATTTTTKPIPSTTSTTKAPTPQFADVPAGSLYASAITAMAASGIVNGFVDQLGGRTFKPGDPIKRQQFAKIIVGALDLPVHEGMAAPFVDLPKLNDPLNLYPHDYVAVAAERGITLGTSLDPPRFSPWGPVTRAQVLTMVIRGARAELGEALQSPPASFKGALPTGDASHGSNIRWAEYNELLSSIELTGWDVWAAATRGEVAQILWNLTR